MSRNEMAPWEDLMMWQMAQLRYLVADVWLDIFTALPIPYMKDWALQRLVDAHLDMLTIEFEWKQADPAAWWRRP